MLIQIKGVRPGRGGGGCPVMTLTQGYSTLRKTVSNVPSKFPKFTTNLTISLRGCQSNRELGNKVVNLMANFVRTKGIGGMAYAPK